MEAKKAFYFSKELIGLGVELYNGADNGMIWKTAVIEVFDAFISIAEYKINNSNTKSVADNMELEIQNQLRIIKENTEEYKQKLESELKKIQTEYELVQNEISLIEQEEREKRCCLDSIEKIKEIVEFYNNQKTFLYWADSNEINRKENNKIDEWYRKTIRCQVLLHSSIV